MNQDYHTTTLVYTRYKITSPKLGHKMDRNALPRGVRRNKPGMLANLHCSIFIHHLYFPAQLISCTITIKRYQISK